MSQLQSLRSLSVSVIGLGQMGSRLAAAFLAAGRATTVHNRTPERADALVAQGATRAATVTDAIAASDVVVICVPDYATVRTLLEPADLTGRTVVNLTSGTPEEARALATDLTRRGAGGYLDGAAMSGTRIVGEPEALFVFSGSDDVFARHAALLGDLGNAVYLGTGPELAALYDTALFSVAWGALAGFYHAVALVGSAEIEPTAFAQVAGDHMPFVTSLMRDHARHIADGHYPDDDGTVDVHAAAMDHLLDASRTQGIGTEVPALVKSLLEQARHNGRGDAGIASVAEAIARRAPARTAEPAVSHGAHRD